MGHIGQVIHKYLLLSERVDWDCTAVRHGKRLGQGPALSRAGMPDLERALGRLKSAATPPPQGLPSEHVKAAQNR